MKRSEQFFSSPADCDLFFSACPCEKESSLLFDIETTGLSASRSMVFLIGTMYWDHTQWKQLCYFAETPEDEAEILSAFFSLSSSFRTLIHFNGNTFDLPFLRTRAQIHKLTFPLSSLQSIDLYTLYRPLRKLLSLPSLKQKELEKLSGFSRTDSLSGRQIITMYAAWQKSPLPLYHSFLLQHNLDDLSGMGYLLTLASYLLFQNGSSLSIEACEQIFSDDRKHSDLQLTFTLPFVLPSPFVSENPLFCLCTENRKGTLKLPLFHTTLRHYFPDYKNYYYLPYEHQVLHKSIASFVDKSCRIPASADLCYIEKEDWYLPQPSPLFSPVFQPSRKEKVFFFPLTEAFLADKEMQKQYLTQCLHFISSKKLHSEGNAICNNNSYK